MSALGAVAKPGKHSRMKEMNKSLHCRTGKKRKRVEVFFFFVAADVLLVLFDVLRRLVRNERGKKKKKIIETNLQVNFPTFEL